MRWIILRGGIVSLNTWSWLYLAAYVALMLTFGVIGSRRVGSADDFAVARKGYGPLMLALAFASTAASGATFLGVPGLSYSYGISIIWLAFLYPVGIYFGVLICQRTIAAGGNASGARSIPEYLGERYESEALRVSAAVFSLMLLFYLAGQLVAGLVMFEIMLGLPKLAALVITTLVLLAYVTFGGAHADILTDGVQGLLMVVLALAIIVLFLLGAGAGGMDAMLDNLRSQDVHLLQWFNRDVPIVASPWSMFALVFAHIPLGLLPHIGNKIWALKNEKSRNRFLIMAFTFGLILPGIALGGLTARAVLGDTLLDGGANTALPAMFIELFPTWLAALLGIGVLAAVMSTADGLVISTSQVFANDIYRRSIAPRWHRDLTDERLDQNVLQISRIVTALVLIGSAVLAWFVIGMNVVLLIWAGVGGFIAALAGPLVLGSIWTGVTTRGALSGFWTGAVAFILIHTGILPGLWPAIGPLKAAGAWLAFHSRSPYSAATMAAMAGVLVTIVVSRTGEQHAGRR